MERRRFMQCMAWAGTGLVWVARGGVLSATTLAEAAGAGGDFTFAQISDTHVGFAGDANREAMGTLKDSIDSINALGYALRKRVYGPDLMAAFCARAICFLRSFICLAT